VHQRDYSPPVKDTGMGEGFDVSVVQTVGSIPLNEKRNSDMFLNETRPFTNSEPGQSAASVVQEKDLDKLRQEKAALEGSLVEKFYHYRRIWFIRPPLKHPI
jgi:hypothetical protein